MPVRAVRDTYALEQTGPDTEVRRLIRAGQLVPDHYHSFEDGKAVEDADTTVGAAGYTYQRGEDPEKPRGEGSKSPAEPFEDGDRARPERPKPRARAEAENEKAIEPGKAEKAS